MLASSILETIRIDPSIHLSISFPSIFSSDPRGGIRVRSKTIDPVFEVSNLIRCARRLKNSSSKRPRIRSRIRQVTLNTGLLSERVVHLHKYRRKTGGNEFPNLRLVPRPGIRAEDEATTLPAGVKRYLGTISRRTTINRSLPDP